jgi:dihydroorotate dehydrogenase electron transfer subunit
MPMLARVAQIAEQFDLPCQVLLEARMACGVGACLGCAVKVKEYAAGGIPGREEPTAAGECGEGEMGSAKDTGIPVIAEVPAFRYASACKEGPVFEAREIFWE